MLFLALAIFSLFPEVSSALALLLGIALALTIGNPFPELTQRWTSRLLQISVVGLGAGINLATVARAGTHGFFAAFISIGLGLLLGNLIGKIFDTDRTTSWLVSVGTAICGGSAIAAVAPVLRAKSHEVTMALATVFFLNSVALLIFPPLGHAFQLSPSEFGLWAALAIHDTSSVVGAAVQYGSEALEIATTVKLVRALWIVPLTFLIGWIWSRNFSGSGDPAIPARSSKKPWFILGFLAMSALVTLLPTLAPTGLFVTSLAKRSLVLTLFLIGSGFRSWKDFDARIFAQGLCLWIILSAASLAAIKFHWL